MCDVTIDDQGGNNNGILDPGETVDLTTTLKNIGDITAFNVEGVLSTTSPYVTINSGNPASWGDIAAGDSSESSPWGITADAGAPVGSVVDFELIVNDNGSYCDTLDFDIVIGVVGVDFVTHNCGNVKLSVTRYGALGYMSSAGTHGEGFCFPVSSGSHLFYGGFAAGTNSSYCVDRYYETTNVDDSDWNTTTSPDGMVRLYEPGPGTIDEYTTARYDDSGHSAPKGLVCDQYGWSWDDATADEFVIMVFDMHNEGASAINDLYAAVFMDWDLGSYTSNQGSSDESRNLTWMYENTPYVGVAILDPPRTTQAVNLSMIDHDLYVYPNGGLPDNVQIQFMDGSIQMPSSDRPYDWSTCNSAGPFTINPGESAIAAFAIIGGNSVSAIQANADTAYNRYWGIQDVKELSSSGSVDFLSVYPAISRGKPYSIQYGLNSGKHINVKVYDTAGRLLIDRQYSNLEKTGTINIAFDKFAQGIYFIQITSSNTTKTAKVIWLK